MLSRAILSLLVTMMLARSALAADHTAHVVRAAVHVDGEVRWRGRAITSPLVWSARGDAVAFTARDERGEARLVVVLVDDALEPTAFSWPVPRSVGAARSVTWLGEGRVGAGPSELRPAMVVAFQLGD